jgi:hypothetical protein
VVGVGLVGGQAFGDDVVDDSLDVLSAHPKSAGDLGDGELAGGGGPHGLPAGLGQALPGGERLAPVAAYAGGPKQFSETTSTFFDITQPYDKYPSFGSY